MSAFGKNMEFRRYAHCPQPMIDARTPHGGMCIGIAMKKAHRRRIGIKLEYRINLQIKRIALLPVGAVVSSAIGQDIRRIADNGPVHIAWKFIYGIHLPICGRLARRCRKKRKVAAGGKAHEADVVPIHPPFRRMSST